MSTPFLPTPSVPQPSQPPDESFPSTKGQDRPNLPTSVEQRRERIRAPELAAEECRGADRDGLIYSRQQEEQRREDRLVREGAATQTLLRHKAVDALDTQEQTVFHQQEEHHHEDSQALDEPAIQAALRYEVAARARKAEEHRLAEESKLAMLRKDDQLAEERRLLRIKERGQKELLSLEQPTQRRRGRPVRDHPYLYAFEQNKAAEIERERKEVLARQEDNRRRQEREARDQACLEALARHEAAATIKKAREAEQRRMAKLKDAEYKRALRDREKELRRAEKQAEKRKRESAIQARKAEGALLRARVERQRSERSLEVARRQAVRDLQEEDRRRDREERDEAGRRALQRHKAIVEAQKAQQKSLTDERIIAYDGVLPSFLEEEFQYMKRASTTFPEVITSEIQMSCMRDYQRAISDASRRLPCGICGGLFQEDDMVSTSLQADDLQYFLQRTKTAPDCCAVKDDMVNLCTTCSSAIAKRAIPSLSAGNFVNCLFCQTYPEALKNLNTVEEAFIARAHVIGIFLKLTSGAKGGISYRGSRGHSIAVRQDPSELLKILPAARLRDHTTITVSWDRGTPPSEANLARFCSVDKAKVVNALLWLCANNPSYRSVVVDYSVLDAWPDHHIPQEIRDAFLTLDPKPGPADPPVEDDREGYATSLRGGLFENELDAEVEDAEPGSILSRSFFSDLHGQDLHSTPATLASLQAILQEQDPDRSGPRGGDTIDVQGDEGAPSDDSRLPHVSYKTTEHLPAMSAFTDPDYFTAAFPTLFPFGIGGHLGDANGDRPEEVSLKAFARYTMLHHSLLFSQHHTFMFYLYDLILIRQASFGNHVQVKNGYWAKATLELSRLSADDLQRAAQEFSDGKKILNPAIHSLITNMRIISSFNPESFGEKMRFRNLIFGKIARLGIPLIWFTLNPKDIGNVFVVRLAGEEISLDEPGIKSKLLQLTIKTPSLVAQFFHVVVTSFFTCIFKTLSREPGIFGTVASHFGIVESTTRMMLHLHGFAWLAGNFGAANLHQRLLSDPDSRDRVLSYIRSIIRETVDLALGQQFASQTPGPSVFTIPDDMTPSEFQRALDIDSNDVAAQNQMHTHGKTCTKYQSTRRPRTRPVPVPTVTCEGAAADIGEALQRPEVPRQPLLQICRFLFPKSLVPASLVTEEGYIRMERNHQYLNKYNPVIASAIRCNHDVNFTPSSPKVLSAIYYMTNYATKAQVDRGQLVLAAAVLKKAQETAEAAAANDRDLPAPEPLDMSKFALKAYNRFTRDVEVGAPAVAHFLLGQPSAYMPTSDKSVTINFYWVKTNVRKVLNSLLNETTGEDVAESANQYVNFDGRTRRTSVYENYEHRGARLDRLCFYEYASQIFVQTFKGAKNRAFLFPFDPSHPLHRTHIQVSVSSLKSLKTPSLCGSFTSMSEKDTDVLDTTLWTQDEIHEVLLGLFYPWNGLQDLYTDQINSLRAAPYKNTWLWNFVLPYLPPYLVQLSENVVLLRRSKEAADQDKKERGIELDDYLEAADHEVYNEDEEPNVDVDFATLRPTESNLLHAALAFPGVAADGLSALRFSRNPHLLGAHFTPAALVKTWSRELKAFKDQDRSDLDSADHDANIPSRVHVGGPEATLVPVLSHSTQSVASLQYLQASFQADPSIDNLLAIITSQYPLNQKQRVIVRALVLRVLHPIRIASVRDQFLLYLGGTGGVGKTHLVKALMFGLSIMQKQDDVLLTASTGAAAANIGGATYHSALGYGKDANQPVRQATRSRLSHKKIFILDEISMVSLEDLVQISDRCDAIWDLHRASDTVFGGLPIVILLGDFNQFRPVRGHAMWSQTVSDIAVLQSGRSIWTHFTHVVFLTEQMRQAEDLVFQDLLQRARSATLTGDDVATLNSCTTESRIAKGETPPERAIIRLNRVREQANLVHLRAFAEARGQKIYLFPARHDAPTGTNLDYLALLRTIYQVGEEGYLKGPGFFAFTKGMPIMLQQNTNTYAGLVNGMRGTAEEVILDVGVQASWIELDGLFVLCTVPLLCVLVRPAHDHNLSFSDIPTNLVPVFPVQMRGQIPSMPGLFFYRHQVPLTLGFAFTDYKSQGSTFVSLILDLLFGKQRGVDQHGKWTSINVQLGRVKSLSGVWLREPITLQDVSFVPHPDLRVELCRLEALEQQTIGLWEGSPES